MFGCSGLYWEDLNIKDYTFSKYSKHIQIYMIAKKYDK